ncbi:ATP-dependent helicase HrpB [Microbulbifer sp. OS29]|uniref:ATP-dependent helicase HrpB n=1 Tax=Microbulbifer okhotskensis TaxID=2926617 RepID=A0A9X2EPG8_9GAMM|nr:ATP-dependent helicase HrpB [Microbulbifer okhotskensis]MCO1335426.1 ATP-dependent helicase HrpB [Microbulbifer okhotskensis]
MSPKAYPGYQYRQLIEITIIAAMSELPIHQVLPQLLQTLAEHSNVVLQAPPGAGKTTAVPLALLSAPWLSGKNIMMLEPRRLAARAAAARMAFQLGETVGETVGYQVRGERRSSAKTRILVVTEGILTRLLQNDPELGSSALVIFDEFHERSLQADLSLALCLQSQEYLRDDLKLLVMSATLDTDSISTLLDDAPVISSDGRSFAVDIEYLSHRETLDDQRQIPALMTRKIEESMRHEEGSLLAFLPGVAEIRQVESLLRERFATDARCGDTIIAPLFGDLTREQQDQAISPCAPGKRKIVLATNVAETSLTIEGIRIVVDSGLMRESRFNPNSGMNHLITSNISQASATQRAGRAGRLSAGYCLRLWSEGQQQSLSTKNTPEIQRSDLAPLALELAKWGVSDARELHWLETPPPGPMSQAQQLLQQLGALDASLRITPHGDTMLAFGVHPRLAHMLVRSIDWGLQQQACLLAALLSERDIFRGEARWDRDISKRIHALQTRSNDHRTDRATSQRVRLQSNTWLSQLQKITPKADETTLEIDSADEIGALLALAYPDRIAKSRRDAARRVLLSSGRGAHFSHDDALALSEYLVVAELDGQGRDARIQLAAEISSNGLQACFADLIKDVVTVRWDNAAGRVEALQQSLLGSLVLQQKPATQVPAETLSQALLDAIRQKGLHTLPWNTESVQLRSRIEFLRQNNECTALMTDTPLPDWSDTGLLESLEEWLLPHLQGLTKLDQLGQLDLFSILRHQLDWSLQQKLDELTPSHYLVPSGSRIRIDYQETPPILAVRLQELFGLAQTPTILKKRYPLMVHLLSPAQRPVQITRNLANFWANTYQEVKKELRIKYQRHYWPDDPLTAIATTKTKKRMDRGH